MDGITKLWTWSQKGLWFTPIELVVWCGPRLMDPNRRVGGGVGGVGGVWGCVGGGDVVGGGGGGGGGGGERKHT